MVIESDGTSNNKPLTRMQVAISKNHQRTGNVSVLVTCYTNSQKTTQKTENRIASSVIFFVNFDIE